MNKKVISLILAGALTTVAICGCSEKKDETNSEVTIKWIMPGPGKQQDSSMVWDEFNKGLKTYEGLENVTVNFDVISASDYAQKFLMAQTGDDPMDIIQTYSLDFVKEARNGSFAPLDEFLDDELKETKSELPEFIFKYGDVDGKLYGITNYQMCPGMWALNLRKDIADKYIDINKIKEATKKKGYAPELYDYIESVLKGAKDNGEMGLGFNPWCSEAISGRMYDTITSCLCVDTYGDDYTVKNTKELPETKQHYARMSDWYKKDYIRKDVISASDLNDNNDKADGSIVFIANNYLGKEEYTSKKTGLSYYCIYLTPNPVIPMTNSAGSLAISANSKHKDIAAKVINLMNCERGKNLYNLLVYGIEGKHYTKTGDNIIETTGYSNGQGTQSSPYGLWKWVVGNTENAYITQANNPDYNDFVFKEFNEGDNTIQSRLLGIKLDATSFSSNIAQIAAVISEYNNPLAYGSSENYESTYNEYIDKLKKCDLEKVMTEIQKQVNSFKDGKNK